MPPTRVTFTLLLTLTLAGCLTPGRGGGDDDDDDLSDQVRVEAGEVSIPTLNGVYVNFSADPYTVRQVYATQGLTCADYQAFWEEGFAAGNDFAAIREAYLGMPGVPGWTVLIEVLEEEPETGVTLDSSLRVTMSELGDEDQGENPIEIHQQIGMAWPEGTLDSFGEIVQGQIWGVGTYAPEWDNTGDFETEQIEGVTVDFRAEYCPIGVHPDRPQEASSVLVRRSRGHRPPVASPRRSDARHP